MNFNERVGSLTPKLRQLALRYKSLCSFFDEDDLYAEMLIFLFTQWRRGALTGKTESYIVQSCYFHLRNFLRTAGERYRPVPLDAVATDIQDAARGLALEEMLADGTPSLSEYTEGRALYATIMNNGFKQIEKNIVRYLVDGFTVREIGAKLGISHAMVVKYKKNIAIKVSKKYAHVLV